MSSLIPWNERDSYGARLGVSGETVRVWLKGESVPDVTQLIKISEVLGVSIDWLLTGKEKQARPGKRVTDIQLYRRKNILDNIHRRLDIDLGADMELILTQESEAQTDMLIMWIHSLAEALRSSKGKGVKGKGKK